MSYCINPKCTNRQNPDTVTHCENCGSSLSINDRYRVIKALRQNPAYPTDIYQVKDWGPDADWGSVKIMKVLKYTKNQNLVSLFQREARALMWLKHPGIPKVDPDAYFTFYPHESSQPLHCLVMEKIEGENLEDWLETPEYISLKTDGIEEDAIDWLKQLTEILHLVHEHNIWHRDIKPSNIIRRPNGQLALIDFGTIALGNQGGTQVGTTGYAAPEQIEGKTALQSDFFALGRTFVHLLTGKSPMEFPVHPKTDKLIWRDSVPDVSKALADLIDDLMEPNKDKRPKNTRKILQRLDEIHRYSENKNSKLSSNNFYRAAAVLVFGIVASRFLIPPINGFRQEFLQPEIAGYLNQAGTDNYSQGKYESAEFYYRLALTVDSDFNKARYGLAAVCERREDFDCAEKQYNLAMQDNNIRVTGRAINNQARLHIFQEQKYDTAIGLLLQGLKQAESSAIELEVKSDLHKNLGWAYLLQNRYQEAEENLTEAIALDEENTPAYCLLAQVYELRQKEAEALQEWKNCWRYDTPAQNPEVNTWKNMAQQRLKASEN